MKDSHALIRTDAPQDAGLSRVQERLERDLARVREQLCALVTPNSRIIQAPILYSVENMGRLLRPTLVLLSSYLVTGDAEGETPAPTIDAAAVVEILHTATLFHDDLIDEAEIRRGMPTANAKYGDDIALLTGDYLLARCMQTAAALGVAQLSLMAQTLVDLCVGQMLETTQLFDPNRSEADYLASISGKTARLMQASTELGALQCGASEADRAALESFGHNLGMAFQIWDDVLDFQDTDTGKETAKDLRNGVYSLPLIYAVKEFPDRLPALLSQYPLTSDHFREVLAVMDECGALGRATDVALHHVTTAMETMTGTFRDRSPVVVRYLVELVGRLARSARQS